jgi:hypothetical protein
MITMKQRPSPLVSRGTLSDVESQFARWRRSRRRGTRIPTALWDAAVGAARDCGVSKVAGALRLDYYKLKQRLEAPPGLETGGGGGAFLEIPLPASPAAECVFELEDAQGVRLRVAVKGASPAELEPLARAFWSLAR